MKSKKPKSNETTEEFFKIQDKSFILSKGNNFVAFIFARYYNTQKTGKSLMGGNEFTTREEAENHIKEQLDTFEKEMLLDKKGVKSGI